MNDKDNNIILGDISIESLVRAYNRLARVLIQCHRKPDDIVRDACI